MESDLFNLFILVKHVAICIMWLLLYFLLSGLGQMRVHLLIGCILYLQAGRLADGVLLIILVEVVHTVCEFDVTPTL
jgi:hypothetical protein